MISLREIETAMAVRAKGDPMSDDRDMTEAEKLRGKEGVLDEDVEGHKLRSREGVDEDDVQGHLNTRREGLDEDDVEGHINHRK
jgi:hypothetical protein